MGGPNNPAFHSPGQFVAPPPQQLPVHGGGPHENLIPPAPPEQGRKVDDDTKEEDPGESLEPHEMALFVTLLTCGRKTKQLEIFNHVVVVQTLCGDDDLRVAMFVKEYQGTLGEQRAYQIAVAAAGVRSIDGAPLATPLGPADEGLLFQEKVKKVSAMYPTVINKIYRGVLDAEKEFVELAERLGK